MSAPAKKPDEVSWYQARLKKSLELIHATGECSRLDIVRCSPEPLHGRCGGDFELQCCVTADHLTPAGSHREFIFCWRRKRWGATTAAQAAGSMIWCSVL